MKLMSLLMPALLAAPLAMAEALMPPGPPGGAMHQGGPMPPQGPGMKLSEEQQDKAFAIEHAQAPQRHELEKALHKAHEGLRAMARSGQFDETKAAALAQAAGQAMAGLELQRTRMDAHMSAMLTPEQRKQMETAPMMRPPRQ